MEAERFHLKRESHPKLLSRAGFTTEMESPCDSVSVDPTLGGPALQTLRNPRGRFKAVRAEAREGRPPRSQERAARGVHVGDRHGVDPGGDLVERNRPAEGEDLAGEL